MGGFGWKNSWAKSHTWAQSHTWAHTGRSGLQPREESVSVGWLQAAEQARAMWLFPVRPNALPGT